MLKFPVAVINAKRSSAKLQQMLTELREINALTSSDDVQKVNEIINQTLEELPGSVTPEKLCRIDKSVYTNWTAIAEVEYMQILSELIRLFDATWPMNVKSNGGLTIDANVFAIFAVNHNASFVGTSLNELLDSTHANKMEILLRIFEQCVRDDAWLPAVLIDMSHRDTECPTTTQDRIVQLLITAPNRIANFYKEKTPEIFGTEQYCAILSRALIRSIYFVCEANKRRNENIFTVDQLAKFLSRLLIDFNQQRNSIVLRKLFQIFAAEKLCHKFIQSILLHLNRNAIEIAAEFLFEFNEADALLGDAINFSNDWRLILQTKLPLKAHRRDTEFIFNLVKYLSRRLAVDEQAKLFVDLLRAWSSKVSIANQTIDQQISLSKFVLLTVKMFAIDQHASMHDDIKTIMSHNFSNHLESLNSTKRYIGMITIEILFTFLFDLLAFDYEKCDIENRKIVDELSASFKWTSEAQLFNSTKLFDELSDIVTSEQSKIWVAPKAVRTVEITAFLSQNASLAKPMQSIEPDSDDNSDGEVDSDDDLMPYDMTNDVSTKELKAPRYLSDLLETIQQTDDPEVFEQCVLRCADLVFEQLPTNVTNIDVQLLRTLIKMDEKFYMENFEYQRFNACIAICCVRPKNAADFLCKEIHAESEHNSVATKMLMLDILGEAAETLASQPNRMIKSTSKVMPSVMPKRRKLFDVDETARRRFEASRTINERLDKKTRRFAQRSQTKLENEQISQFSSVAGDFFFPLVHGLVHHRRLSEDIDNLLLREILMTASKIILAAKNSTSIVRIATEALDVSTLMRYHPEAKVRAAVMHMIAATLLAVTPTLLLELFMSQLKEICVYAEMCLSSPIVNGEKDDECREIATHILSLCADIMAYTIK